MTEKKKMLVVLAHPDDESFGMGGSLAYYAAKDDVDVYLVCATRGEVGEVEPEFMKGYETKGELREAELRCAAEKLGLKQVDFLDYRDSGMLGSPENDHPNSLYGQPVDKVAAKVVHAIRELRPEVVVTFDPVGGYHHPDHIAIHQATVRAFYAANDPQQFVNGQKPFQPDKLYYSIFPRKFIRGVIRILKLFGVDVAHFGRNKDINLEELAGDDDYPYHVKINYREYVKQRDAASECHASQLDFGRQSGGLLSWFRRLTGGKDYFMQAYPQVPDNFRARDLFYQD
jgi:LmbE family N-acetylglucosaminyl deacetylase